MRKIFLVSIKFGAQVFRRASPKKFEAGVESAGTHTGTHTGMFSMT